MNRRTIFEEVSFWCAIVFLVCALLCLFVAEFEAFIASIFWLILGLVTLNESFKINRRRNRR